MQYATLENGYGVLLTADVGPVGLDEAADFAATLRLNRPRFVQIPHHGSRHNVTPAVLDRWLGPKKAQGTRIGIAFCSIGANKPDYPRGQVKNAFIRRGYEVFANREQMISHFFGEGHQGLFPLTPELFDNEVKAP